jgi:tetraacyldisaccharide 4'-kinase
LVQYLSAQGLRVGVLSRGYGRKCSAIQAVTPNSTADEVGDEPLLIARNCQVPVYVGAHRAKAGRLLLSQHPDVQMVVCDDGLQHWQLARDLEICVFDERHVGNAHLLPAGPLRESWPRQAWHAPATRAPIPCLVVNTADKAGPNEFNVHRSLADFALQADGTQRPLSSWHNTAVSALAGIAKPEVFFAMLRAKGLALSHTVSLPDHADVQALASHVMQGDVLCTEKDAVKLWPHHPKVWAVPLQTELPPELRQAIDTHLHAASPPKLSSPHGQQTA